MVELQSEFIRSGQESGYGAGYVDIFSRVRVHVPIGYFSIYRAS